MATFIPWATAFGALAGAGAGLVVTILLNSWREISAGPRSLGMAFPAEPLVAGAKS